MKVGLLKDVLVLMLMIVVIFIICIFLPKEIPVHFNQKEPLICLLINIIFCLLRLFRILLIGNLYEEGKIKRLSEYSFLKSNTKIKKFTTPASTKSIWISISYFIKNKVWLFSLIQSIWTQQSIHRSQQIPRVQVQE